MEEKKIGKLIGIILVLIWAICSMAFLAIFAGQNKIGLALIVFGQFFLCFGVVMTISKLILKRRQAEDDLESEKKVRKPLSVKNLIGILFIYVGLATGVSGYIIQFGPEKFKQKEDIFLAFSGLLLFLFVGLGLSMIGISRIMYAKKYITEVIEAKVVKIHANYSRDEDGVSKTYLYPIWDYEFYGVHYSVKHPIGTTECKYSIGDVKKIRINPDNPEEAYFGPTVNITLICWGLFFIMISVFAFYYFFKGL